MSVHHFNYDFRACEPPSEEIRVENIRDGNIVNIEITFGNLRPNKFFRRNYDTVQFRTFNHIRECPELCCIILDVVLMYISKCHTKSSIGNPTQKPDITCI